MSSVFLTRAFCRATVEDGAGGETVFPKVKVANDTRDPKVWSDCARKGLAVKAVSFALLSGSRDLHHHTSPHLLCRRFHLSRACGAALPHMGSLAQKSHSS